MTAVATAPQQDPGFPPLDDAQGQQENKSRKPFTNQLFPNDSLTVCNGFINEVRPHTKGDRTMYFVSVGAIQGSVADGEGYKGDISNFDLLAGPTLEKWLAPMAGLEDPLKGIRFSMEIRNLKFTPKLHDGKAYLDSRGILETVTIGRLDKPF